MNTPANTSAAPPYSAPAVGTGAAAPVRVLIVDDQELVREGIASLLGIQPGVAVVGTAADGRQAVEAAVTHRPDVALVDVRMPGMDGIEATAVLAARVPSCRIVMLTTFDDQDYVARALRAGAVGYLLKNLPSAELARAVRLVHAGVAQLDASVMTRLAAALAAPGPTGPAPDGPGPTATDAPGHRPPGPGPADALTGREVDVLRLVAGGSTNREIATRLHLSEGTVKNHISRILGRLGLRDRTQAALYAHDQGLL
ncbi:response regulator transcription factor [Streptomyces sp. NPDC002138]|uniref:response regulator transcription factor n=1 Tax=Streptomyces sp. NPDC002138 TaxID=3154410 RepID=UPI00331BDB26